MDTLSYPTAVLCSLYCTPPRPVLLGLFSELSLGPTIPPTDGYQFTYPRLEHNSQVFTMAQYYQADHSFSNHSISNTWILLILTFDLKKRLLAFALLDPDSSCNRAVSRGNTTYQSEVEIAF